MKKIASIILIVFSMITTYRIYGIEVSGIPKIIKQGDFFVVDIQTKNNEKSIKIDSEISKTKIKVFEYENQFYALVPANYYTDPGEYDVVISYENNGIENKQNYEIEVVGTKSVQSKLVVKKELEEKNCKKNKEEMYSAVQKARANSEAKKIWEGNFLMPVQGRVSTDFAYERFVNGKLNGKHSGIDIAQKLGTPIKSVNNGIVVYSDYLRLTGNTVIIDHGFNLFSSYSHLNSVKIKKGDVVQKGEIIGTVGNSGFSTAPHLHFTFTIGDTFVNPWSIIEKEIIE